MISTEAWVRPRRGESAPNGWTRTRLGDVVREAKVGFACGERDPSGVIQMRMNNVTSTGQIDWSSYIRVPADPKTIDDYRLERGDVLFNNTNSTDLVGKSAIFKPQSEPIVFSNRFTRLRTDEGKLLPEFLAFWLQSQWHRGLFADICNKWIGQSAIQRTKLLELEIAIPTLNEQRRIASALCQQTAAVHRARAAVKAELEAAAALEESYLRAVFGSDEAHSWPSPMVEDLRQSGILTEHQDGNHGELYPRTKDFVASGVAFLSAKHIRRGGTLDLDEAPRITQGLACSLRIGHGKAGDVLLAHNATVGPVGMAPTGCDAFVVGTSLTIFRSDPGRLLPRFLLYALKSKPWQRQLADAMKQTTRNQVPISRQRNLRLPLPSVQEQSEIVAALDRHLSASEKLTIALEEQELAIRALPHALLKSAFSGTS